MKQPIVLSIETKREGEDWATAGNQSSIWLLAHLKHLRCLSIAISGGGQDRTPELGFLPGLIVQGRTVVFCRVVCGETGCNNSDDCRISGGRGDGDGGGGAESNIPECGINR